MSVSVLKEINTIGRRCTLLLRCTKNFSTMLVRSGFFWSQPRFLKNGKTQPLITIFRRVCQIWPRVSRFFLKVFWRMLNLRAICQCIVSIQLWFNILLIIIPYLPCFSISKFPPTIFSHCEWTRRPLQHLVQQKLRTVACDTVRKREVSSNKPADFSCDSCNDHYRRSSWSSSSRIIPPWVAACVEKHVGFQKAMLPLLNSERLKANSWKQFLILLRILC